MFPDDLTWGGGVVVGMLSSLLQGTIVALVRPYVSRELPGWGKLYSMFVGDYHRDWFWVGAPIKQSRGKLDGCLIELDLSRAGQRQRFFLGRWSQLEIQSFIADTVTRSDTVLDIGANIGDFSLFAARFAAKVIAFEPNPNCCAILKKKIAVNGIQNIFLRAFGLGNTCEDLNLSVQMQNQISALGSLGQTDDPSMTNIPVKIDRGDDVLREESPTLIKIDVEGFECQTISGLLETIGRCRPIIITEIAREHLMRCGGTPERLVEMITDLGYAGYALKLADRRGSYRLIPINLRDAEFDAVWLPI